MSRGTLECWEDFVITHGWRARASDLAAVLGQPEEAIARLRNSGVCRPSEKAKGFVELFVAWSGREPTEDEWPRPLRLGTDSYEWQAPELALLAALVGQISKAEIAEVLTARLREKTGDPEAERSVNAVQVAIGHLGLQSTDVVGGMTINEAAREIGSLAIVHQAIAKGHLRTWRVGRLHVISIAAWNEWKATRVYPPDGYVRLSTLRQPLGIKSDKLSEYAKMGLVPSALRCQHLGVGGPSSAHGTWWVPPDVAEQLLADRRAGKPMPWHGKYSDNLRTTFKLWQERKHPDTCSSCATIWGEEGAPNSFDDFCKRYPNLAHGAKRHLTRIWSPGITLAEVAMQAGKAEDVVRLAISNGALASCIENGVEYVTRTDATRWIARHCPDGEGARSWLSIETASKRYLFTIPELRGFIAAGRLRVKHGTEGAARGVVYVPRQQCAQLREAIGFTEEEAARRLEITVERFRRVLEGVAWRTAERIPLVTVQAVQKRLDSKCGYSIAEAAARLGQSEGWVLEQIAKGKTRVSRAKWDQRRLYLSEPMFERLRKGMQMPEDPGLGKEWLSVSEAAIEAGVSPTTLNAWGNRGELSYRSHKKVRRYHRAAVRARARTYWQEECRFRRATMPDWLQGEGSQ